MLGKIVSNAVNMAGQQCRADRTFELKVRSTGFLGTKTTRPHNGGQT